MHSNSALSPTEITILTAQDDLDPTAPLPQVDTLADFAPESELSLQAQRLIDFHRKRVPSKVSKANIVREFQSVFSMIGGIPRLALWADQNPGAFYSMYSKLLPQEAKLQLSQTDPTEETLKDLSTNDLKMLLLRSLSAQATDAQITTDEQDGQSQD